MEYNVCENIVRETGCIFKGKVNEILAVENVSIKKGGFDSYIIIKITDKEISKKLAAIPFKYMRKDFIPFSAGDNFCFLARDMQSREIGKYLNIVAKTYSEKAVICREILTRLKIALDIPYSIIYLMLKQKKLNLSDDKNIYFTYDIDFSEFDENIGERECAIECARIIEELLGDKEYEGYIIMNIIRRKNAQAAYNCYQDVIEDANDLLELGKPPEKHYKLKRFFRKNKRIFAGILIGMCIVALLSAGIVFLINNFDFGRITDVIGFEHLDMP